MKPLVLRPVRDLNAFGRRSRRRWVYLAMAAFTLLALCAWWLHGGERQPRSLDDSELVGDRSPGCIRLIVANDISGSMSKYTAAREGALRQLLTWAPRNLRADDELAVVDFSGSAVVTMAPTAIGAHPSGAASSASSDGTALTELLRAVRGLASSRCASALVLFSDAVFQDLPTSARAARDGIVDARLSTVHLLVPGKSIPVDPNWKVMYPYAKPQRFDGENVDKTGLAIAYTLASITGQHLKAV